MRDINNTEDVKKVVDQFYGKVMKDPIIGFFFTDVSQIDLPSHLPKMYDFWSSMLLGIGSYKGNPMTAHIELHKKSPITQAHFDHWRKLFFETLDEHFEGSKVEEAKTRVNHMIPLMKFKIDQSEEKGFIQ